jgi:hypothetical protein
VAPRRAARAALFALLITVLVLAVLNAAGPVKAAEPQQTAHTTPAIVAGAIRSAANHGLCLDNTQGRNPDWHQQVGLSLGSCGRSTRPDAPGLVAWRQIWTIEADHTIRIGGLCLTSRVPMSTVTRLLPCGSARGQRWAIVAGQIRATSGQYCLAAPSPPAASQARATAAMRRCDARSAGQRWLVPGSSPASADLSAVGQLLHWYNWSGQSAGLFSTPTDPGADRCSNAYRRGNCWWWSALSMYALTDAAEQDPSATITVTSIKAVIGHTYKVICGTSGNCPHSPGPFAGKYYDDTAWWALAWVNAWRLTGDPRYLGVAEDLWSYITRNAWDRACGGGFVQHAGTNRSGKRSTQDAIVNVLYLRLSAWLYVQTARRGAPGAAHAARYLNGVGGAGGARKIARWLAGDASHAGTARTAPSRLISGPYLNIAAPGSPARPVSAPGARFMIADHLNGSCTRLGLQMWLSTEGIAVAGLADMYEADKIAGDTGDGRYYLRVADNLADTVMTDAPKPHQDPPGDLGSYYLPGNRPIAPPTVDRSGILSEPCLPPRGQAARWPTGCVLDRVIGTGHGDAAFLPDKGVFVRSLYCLGRTLPAAGLADPAIARFIATNAASAWTRAQDESTTSHLATDLNRFGFLWGNYRFAANNSTLNFATQTSAVELLNAALGGSTAMC